MPKSAPRNCTFICIVFFSSTSIGQDLVVTPGTPTVNNSIYPSGPSNNTVSATNINKNNTNLYSGYGDYGEDVNNNTLTITGSVFDYISGGYSTLGSIMNNNTVTITNTTANNASGGYTKFGSTSGNKLTIDNSNITATANAGKTDSTTSSNFSNNNSLIVKNNSTISIGVGGWSAGITDSNSLYIENSTATGRLVAGLGSVVTNNTITIKDSNVQSDIFAGELKYKTDQSKSINNNVTLLGNVSIGGSLYGGVVTTPEMNGQIILDGYQFGYDIVTGNTLTIAPTTQSITVGGNAANFSFINFDFSDFPTGDPGPAAQYPTGGDAALVVSGFINLFPGGYISNIGISGTNNSQGRIKLMEAGQALDFRGTAITDIPGLNKYNFLTVTPFVDAATPNILYVDYGLNWFFQNTDAHGTFILNDNDSYSMGYLLNDQASNLPTWDGKSLIKEGTGTLVLEEDNTYTGTTTITGGTLQLGDGSTQGSINNSSEIINNAQLVINHSANFTLANLTSGTGSITQAGTGILQITNSANSYSGFTNINAGSLQISVLDAFGSSIIRNSTQVTFDNAVGNFNNAITGTGTVTFSNGSDVRLLVGLAASNITIDANNIVTLASAAPFVGDVINKGDLIVDSGTTDRTLSNNISDVGSVTQNSNAVLLMTGNNTYSGGTYINSGTVAISNMAALGTGDVYNDATLAFSGANGDFTNTIWAPQATPGDSLIRFADASNVRIMTALSTDSVIVDAGSTATVMDGLQWTIANSVSTAGNLLLGANSTVAGNIDVTGTLALSNSAMSADIIGNVSNSGNIRLDIDNQLDSRLRIDGDYSGNNGVLSINTQLSDDNSATDRLSITGNATGRTRVNVTNIGGLGGQTEQGIRIIETGTSTADAFFLQNGYLSAGAYDYSLLRRTENATDNWYLVEGLPGLDGSTYTPNLGSVIANAAASNNMFNMRYADRAGGLRQIRRNPEDNLWLRYSGNRSQFTSLKGQLHTDGHTSAMQVGIGLPSLLDSDAFDLGVMAGYGHYKGDTHSSRTQRKSSSSLNGYSLGMYATWFSDPERKNGTYVDSWLLWNSFHNRVKGADDHTYTYKSKGITAGIEIGHSISLGQIGATDLWIQPQAQVIYQGVKADKFEDIHQISVKPGSDNLQLRTGIKTYAENVTLGDSDIVSRPFIELNYIHNSHPYSSQIASENYRAAGGKDVAEVRLGLESKVANNHQLWVNASYADGGKRSTEYSLHMGWKYNF